MVRPDYLETAVGAARWILSRQIGSHWPSWPAAGQEEELDLYYGNAGAILFFRELAESTGDQRYRQAALTGAGYIAAHLGNLTPSGLFHGLAGAAFALQQMTRGKEEKDLLDSLKPRNCPASNQCHPGQAGSMLERIERYRLRDGRYWVGLDSTGQRNR